MWILALLEEAVELCGVPHELRAWPKGDVSDGVDLAGGSMDPWSGTEL